MRANHIQTNFTAGEITPRLHTSPDLVKYANGAATVENFIVYPHGGASKRPGTIFVSEVKNHDEDVRLQEFQFNTEQSYMLLFGPGYIWFYKDGGIITHASTSITAATQANPCVVTATAHGLSNGDTVTIANVSGMTQLNNRVFTVANATANTIELSGVDSTAYDAYTSGGTVAEIVETTTSYTEAGLKDLRFAQSADVMYISCPICPVKTLSRLSETNWVIADAEIENGPFRTINADDTKKFFTSISSATKNVSGATKADPVVITTSAAHGYESGECVTFASVGGMTQLNGNRYFIIKLSDTTFSLRDESYRDVDGTAYGTYTSGGTVNRSITKWGTYSEGATGITLSTDFSFFTADHVGMQIKLWEPGLTTRYGEPIKDTSISNSTVYTKDGKVYGVNDLVTATVFEQEWLPLPDHDRGVVNVSDLSGTKSYDAVYLHGINCIVEITGFTNSTTATCKVVRSHIPNGVITNGTDAWAEGSFNEIYGYPRAIAFHQQRLWLGGTDGEPQTIWASVLNAFLDFEEDAEAIIAQIVSQRVDVIRWMLGGPTLVVGTVSSEYSISAAEGGAITPETITVKQETSYGTTEYDGIRIAHKIIFPQRFGDPANPARKIIEHGYSFQDDRDVGDDLTIISEHITGTGILELSYQQEPDRLIWANRVDGQLVGCTYERRQDVVGWHRHIIGGTDPVVKTIGSIPNAYGDALYMVVSRTVNGATKRYVEFLNHAFQESETKEDAIFMDSAVSYNGAATTTISGLWHLEGELVQVIGDGAVQPKKTVTNGEITITSASVVHVGLPYTSTLVTLPVEAGASQGTAQTRLQKIHAVFVNVYRSLGGKIGFHTLDADVVYYRKTTSLMDDSPDLVTGIIKKDINGSYDRRAQVKIEHEQPYPFTVLSVVKEVNTSDN